MSSKKIGQIRRSDRRNVLLARKGHNVLGVDRAQFPSDTVSTHFMWPRTTAFLAKWGGGGPRVSPSLYQEYGRGLLIVRLLGVAGRYDAPELPLLPCRGWTRLINSRGRSRSWGRQFRLPLTGYHRNQRRTLGTLSPRSQ